MSEQNPSPATYANGFTLFSTVEGLDVILRTDDGETRGRLSTLSAPSTLTGVLDDEPISARIVSEDAIVVTYGERSWTCKRPDGKSHWFAFLDQWPAKAEACGVAEMLKRLRKAAS